MSLYLVYSRRPGDAEWRCDAFAAPSKAQAVALFLECDGCEVKREVQESVAEVN